MTIKNRATKHVFEAIGYVEAVLPSPISSLDMGNGGTETVLTLPEQARLKELTTLACHMNILSCMVSTTPEYGRCERIRR